MFDALPANPGIEVELASQGISKGLLQSTGPQLLVRPELAFGPLFVGGYAKNVSFPSDGWETSVTAGVRGSRGGTELGTTIAHKWLVDIPGAPDRDAFEFGLSARRRMGKFSLAASGVFSPNDLGGSRESLYVEGSALYAITKGTSLGGGVGRRDRDRSSDYTAFNLALVQTILPNLTLTLRYHDTARSDLGRTFEPRVVASLRARF